MRIAVLGLGFMGSTHLKSWSKLPGATIAAVSSEDPRKLDGDLSSVQGNLGGPGERYDFSGVTRHTSWAQAAADPGVDAVDICLPTHLHSEATLTALRAGKHVLVEKPMALDAARAAEMIAEAKKQSRILMAAQVLRFVPSYRAVSEAVVSGQYGSTRAAFFRRRCAAPFWNKWLDDASKSGGGVFDLLIHDIDFCIQLFGMPEAVSATGFEDLQAGIDNITATLHYRSVPSVVISGGWHHKKAYPFSMEYTVVTDGGTFEYSSSGEPGVRFYGADGESRATPLREEDGFDAEISYFHDCCVRNVLPEFCPPEQSAAAVALTLLLLKARTRSGERVKWES